MTQSSLAVNLIKLISCTVRVEHCSVRTEWTKAFVKVASKPPLFFFNYSGNLMITLSRSKNCEWKTVHLRLPRAPPGIGALGSQSYY